MKTTENKLVLPIMMAASLVGVVLLQDGFIFLLIALLPTIVAYFIDHDEYKSVFRIVMLCNIAALLPYIIPIVDYAIKLQSYDVMKLMTDPKVWLVIYSGAAIGWCLVFMCRFIGRFLIAIYFDYQIKALERFQSKLLIEWGERIKEGDVKATD